MKEVKKRDNARNADITIILNENDDVIGVRFEFLQPIPIIDFNLDRIILNPRTRIPMFPGPLTQPWVPESMKGNK